MSKYSTTLRYIVDVFGREEVESWFTDWDFSEYLTPSQIKTIENAKIFDKQKLAERIVDNYFMREIGCETVGLFKHYAKVRMREIMGDYAQIIYSASIQFDPLVNEDFKEEFTRNTNTTGNSTTSSTGSGFGITQDTPQSQITKSDLMAGKYASTATGDETTTSGQTDATGNEQETTTHTSKGNRGISSNIPYLLTQYRDFIRNLYGDVIEACNDLFMGIY